jgi:uncharacterized protein YjbJ (UPF0337 family)
VNWDRLEGQWKQRRGKAVYHWGKMMNDELSAILGKYEELVGKLQEKYGIAKDEARHRVGEYKIIVKQLKQANSKLVKLHKVLGKKRKSEKRRTKTKVPSRKQR